jgi:hypothetical protein
LIQVINPQQINNSCGKINLKKINPGSPSYQEEEEKILFFIHFVFFIGQVEQTDANRHLCQADLTRANDNDP